MRSAEQLTRSPREYLDHRAAERQKILAELEQELARARDQGAPWYRWILDRQAGRHQHELRDESSRRIACPVAGCTAVAGVDQPHTLASSRARRS